ncbi:hypothetical protein [Nocardia suismassiliense]|uniref:hypothetical protein n=1 Tax=Nocardia suismassiliense TaxID=2077092 RepID=UPI00131F2046|nr:hypothetical protein [Nocardia suismassiliense]
MRVNNSSSAPAPIRDPRNRENKDKRARFNDEDGDGISADLRVGVLFAVRLLTDQDFDH